MNEKLLVKLKSIFGNKIYLVGGSVRDFILNRESHDYDFTTSLTPDEIEELLKSKSIRTYLIGKRFGTIAAKIEKEQIEITTFREEKYVKGSRKPEVNFVKTLNEDLARRDFTINAMAMRGSKIIDPYKGQEDIKNKIIRAVGLATTRFKEDPLRMLRAVRFSAQLGFEIEKNTFDRITKYSYKILEVSKERWMMELDKILLSDYTGKGLVTLFESDLLKYMIPELAVQFNYNQNNPHHRFSLDLHTMKVVCALPKDINLRWAGLLHDIGKPFVNQKKIGKMTYVHHDLVGAEMVEKIARYLKWSNERRETVKELVLNHLKEDSPLREADNGAKQ